MATAKKKAEAGSFVTEALAKLRQKDTYGQYIAFAEQSATMSSTYLDPALYFRSGITVLDMVLGRKGLSGLGSGRMTELYGQNKTGKTALATLLYQQAMMDHDDVYGVYIDMERALTRDRIDAFPIMKSPRSLIMCPGSLNMAFSAMKQIMEKAEEEGKSLFFVFDSVAAMRSDSEMQAEDGKLVRAGQAQVFSTELPRIRGILSKTDSHLLMLNQMRDKQGAVSPGMPAPDHTPGGKAIGFYADYRIKTAAVGKYSLRYGIKLPAGTYPSGFVSQIKVIKNKVGIPERQVKVPLVYFPNQGFNSGLSEPWSLFMAFADAKLLKATGGAYTLAGSTQRFGRVDWTEFLAQHRTSAPGEYPVYTGVVAEAIQRWSDGLLTDAFGGGAGEDDDDDDGLGTSFEDDGAGDADDS